MQISVLLLSLAACLSLTRAFSPAAHRAHPAPLSIGHPRTTSATVLRMAPPADGKGGMEKSKDTKKGVSTIVIDDTDTEMQEDEVPEEQWRVVLHNDEVRSRVCSRCVIAQVPC